MMERTGRVAVLEPDPGARVAVFGDIHGDLVSLEAGLGMLGSDDLAVFLGDYADRGPEGVEVIERIDQLLDAEPDRFIGLMGNHEAYAPDGRPTFSPCTLISEAAAKRGSWTGFFERFSRFVSKLSIAAILPERALFVHGGLHPDMISTSSLASPEEPVETDILWGDPGDRPGQTGSRRGIGHLFGPDVTTTVLGALGVRQVFRSHQPQRAKKEPVDDHDGRVITLSSTDVYGGLPHLVLIPPASSLDQHPAFEVRYLSHGK